MSAENTALFSPNNYNTAELVLDRAFTRHSAAVLQLVQEKECISQAACLAALLKIRFDEGRKLLICGNGGSAADAQHFAAELVVRYKNDRRALPAIALTTDTSTLTAGANDLGYDSVFDRQVQALGVAGDVLISFSTSGNSNNVCWAVEAAKRADMTTVSFTGASAESYLARASDWCIRVPSTETARIQEMHQILYHGICEALDELYATHQVSDAGQGRNLDSGHRETAARQRSVLVAGGAAGTGGFTR